MHVIEVLKLSFRTRRVVDVEHAPCVYACREQHSGHGRIVVGMGRYARGVDVVDVTAMRHDAQPFGTKQQLGQREHVLKHTAHRVTHILKQPSTVDFVPRIRVSIGTGAEPIEPHVGIMGL